LQPQRRLGDVELLGGAGDVANLDDLGEVAKLPQVDGASSRFLKSGYHPRRNVQDCGSAA